MDEPVVMGKEVDSVGRGVVIVLPMVEVANVVDVSDEEPCCPLLFLADDVECDDPLSVVVGALELLELSDMTGCVMYMKASMKVLFQKQNHGWSPTCTVFLRWWKPPIGGP